MSTIDKFSRGTANHEAGHAVVAWFFDLPVRSVRVEAEDDSGSTEIAGADQLPLTDHLAVLAAGYTAENIFNCWGPKQAASDDHGRIASILEHNGIDPEPRNGPREVADNRARSILQAHAQRVLRLVDGLVANGHVDGDEFLRLMDLASEMATPKCSST